MTAFVHDNSFDAGHNYIAGATVQTVCAGEPLTFYEGYDAPAWTATTAKVLGDAVRPVTRAGRTMEATAISGAGQTGAIEPTWNLTVGATTVDGDITWTTRNSFAITENSTLIGADFSNANGDTSGRKLSIVQKPDANIHTDGTANHVTTIRVADRILTTRNIVTPQPLTAGGTVTVPAHDITETTDAV